MVALETIARDVGAERPIIETSSAAAAVVVASDVDRQRWDDYVNSHEAASGYHVWDWGLVFTRSFGHEPIYLMAVRGERVCGVLPLVLINSVLFGRTLTSLPFLNYGGVAADDEQAGNTLLQYAAELARRRRCQYVELRHVGRQFSALPFKQHKVAMRLELTTLGWERLDKKVRNQIRKAQKSDLMFERGGLDLLGDFYDVFARNMRDLGTPVCGRTFFAEVLRTFPSRTQLHVVRLAGRAIAAGFTYRTGDVLEIPWASSIRDYNHLCPNYLLYWNALEFARDSGCRSFDFGRSTPGEGTYKFKEQWGASAVPLHWEYALAPGAATPNTSPTNSKFAVAIELWKRLPMPIANWLGPHIVRGIP